MNVKLQNAIPDIDVTDLTRQDASLCWHCGVHSDCTVVLESGLFFLTNNLRLY